MPLVKAKPTSPGSRALVKDVTPELHNGDRQAPLASPQRTGSGRNNYCRPGTVKRIEHAPNRSARLLLLLYRDGERRYVIAPKGVAVGTQLMSGAEAPIKPGNTLPLRNIPVGTKVHCVEMQPGKGAQLARSAGAHVQG